MPGPEKPADAIIRHEKNITAVAITADQSMAEVSLLKTRLLAVEQGMSDLARSNAELKQMIAVLVAKAHQ